MTGWRMLSWGAACTFGVLTFLKLVANELQQTQQNLEAYEKMEIKEAKRRLETQPELMTVEAELPGLSSRSRKR